MEPGFEAWRSGTRAGTEMKPFTPGCARPCRRAGVQFPTPILAICFAAVALANHRTHSDLFLPKHLSSQLARLVLACSLIPGGDTIPASWVVGAPRAGTSRGLTSLPTPREPRWAGRPRLLGGWSVSSGESAHTVCPVLFLLSPCIPTGTND